MHFRTRVLFLACAACTVLHLPSSTAAPFSPPLVQAINRAIASIFVQAAVSRGIAEDDTRTTASLRGIQDVLTDAADRVTFARSHVGLSWMSLWSELGRQVATKILGGDKHAQVEIDLQKESFQIKPLAQPPYPRPVDKSGEQTGDLSFDNLFRAVKAGLRVYRTSHCRFGKDCEPFPLVTDVDWVAAKYRQDQADFVILTNSLDDVRAMATINCFYWWGAASGVTGVIYEGSDSVTLGCVHQEGERTGPSSRFKVRQDSGAVTKMLEQPGMKTLPIAADSMTELVNGLWKQAASEPNYKGIPFQPEKPIEAKAVEKWFAQEPDKVPTLNDLFAPSRPNRVAVPIVDAIPPRVPGRGVPPVIPGNGSDRIPGTTPDTHPGVMPGSKPDAHSGTLPGTPPTTIPGTQPGKVPDTLPGSIPGAVPDNRSGALPSDIANVGTAVGVGSVTVPGVDARTGVGQDVNVVNQPSVHVANPVRVEMGDVPKIQIPTLESTPTARMILQPLLDLLPGFRSWKPPSHNGECPRPTFQVFRQSVRMDAMCDIAQKNQSAIHASMTLVFALAALFIVLSA